jgi:fructokinase
MDPSPTVVGLGEILWDLLPSGRRLGGAPANFAYCSHLLGNRALIASRVGCDDLASEIHQRLHEVGISSEFLQTDDQHPTGTVNVQVDIAGQPKFEITYPAAWDFLEWNRDLQALAHRADAVCFGTLAQRSEQSHRSILKFLESTRNDCLRIFDVNLRQSFYSAQIIKDGMRHAVMVKLNDQELPVLARLLGIPEESFCKGALEKFHLRLVCVTRGKNGSMIFANDRFCEHPGFHVVVNDTVGAGDAFTAGLAYEYLRGSTPEQMNDTANRIGAWVASCSGAMPTPPAQGLMNVLAGLQALGR